MRRLAWLIGFALLGSALTKWMVVSIADERPRAACNPSSPGPDGPGCERWPYYRP